MAYIGLVHRASGIFVFSYWPKAPRTWNSLGRLNNEINAGLADAQLQARLIDLGQTVVARSATEFAQRIAADADKWANVIQRARINI